MIYLLLIFIAGFFNGFDDVDFNMYYGSKINTKGWNPDFWNPFVSFKTAVNILFFRLDAWHIAKTIWVGAIFAAITFHAPFIKSWHWWYDMGFLPAVWYAGQQLAFKIFK